MDDLFIDDPVTSANFNSLRSVGQNLAFRFTLMPGTLILTIYYLIIINNNYTIELLFVTSNCKFDQKIFLLLNQKFRSDLKIVF